MSNSQTVKTVADSYRAMSSPDQNSSLTEATFTNVGDEPTRSLYAIAAHVSKLANASKKDPTLHQLAHDIHSNIANSHNMGGFDGSNTSTLSRTWASASIGAKHLAAARWHAKHF